jgi:Fur family iron response transcriptional regulator
MAMDRAMEAACREELRRAGLPGQGALVRLLALLRAAPESHLNLREVQRMAQENKLAIASAELDRNLQMLADRGLLGRLPSTAAEPVFDTIPEPHSHLVYEATGQIIDLHVSPETLLAVVRRALAEQSDRVEVLVRIRSISDDRRGR